MSELYLNGVTVNSAANAQRISLVEQCFGAAGQPLTVPGEHYGVSRFRMHLAPKIQNDFFLNIHSLLGYI